MLSGNNYGCGGYINNNNMNTKEKYEHLIEKNLFEDKNNYSNSISSMELHKICRNSINRILNAKPFYMALKNVDL